MRWGIRQTVLLTAVAAAVLTQPFEALAVAGVGGAAGTKSGPLPALRALTVPFMANEGQWDPEALFAARTFAGTVFISREGEIVYVLPARGERAAGGESTSALAGVKTRAVKNKEPDRSVRGLVLREVLLRGPGGPDGRRGRVIRGREPAGTSFAMILGNDPKRWRSRLPAYHAVDLGEVYDRIGLTLRAHGDNVEKVFRVAPGGDPGQIRLQLEGAQGLRITETGELEIATPEGPFRFSRPVAYQEDEEGRRTPVVVSYRLLDEPSVPAYDFAVSAAGSYPADGRPVSSYAFALADYDRSRELVIDPLIAATYLGGSDGEWAAAVAAAPDGRVYVAGGTQSADFPKTGGPVADIGVDGFVALFDAGLTRLEAGIVFGGVGLETGTDLTAIALESRDGETAGVYVAGWGWGPDLPLVGGAYSRIRGTQDYVIARFSPDLSRLEASTVIGGSRNWAGNCGAGQEELSAPSIALDGQGNVFLAGNTGAWDYPTTADAYSRQCGRSGWCDHQYQLHSGSTCPTDVVISKFSPDLAYVLASTYLGGGGGEFAASIAVNQTDGTVAVAGATSSLDFPVTSGAWDPSCGADGRCNNEQVRTSGCGGYYHCSPVEDRSVCNNAYTFPYMGCVKLQPDDPTCTELCCRLVETCIPNGCGFGETRTPDGACVRFGKGDGFAVRMDGQLRSLLAGTYLGGSENDWADGVLPDRSGGLFITGTTTSPDFALPAGGWQAQHNGFYDTYVLKMDEALSAPEAGTYLGCGLEPHWGRGVRYSLFPGPEGGLYVGGALSSIGGSCRSAPGAFEARPGTGTFEAGLGASFLALISEDLKSRQAATFFNSRAWAAAYGGPSGRERVYLAGVTSPTLTTTPDAAQRQPGDTAGRYDAFVAVLDPRLSDPGRRRFGGTGENPFTYHDGLRGAGSAGALGMPACWVNTANRNLVATTTDFASNGLGPALLLSRTWNPDPLRPGLFGNGWSFGPLRSLRYHAYITSPLCPPPDDDMPPPPPPPSPEAIRTPLSTCVTTWRTLADVVKGSGQVLAYASEDGGATFKPDFADVRDELTMVAGTPTYFLLKERDSQLIYRFDCPSAYCAPTYNVTTTIPLTSVTDRNGNAVRYAYNADGTLRTITDAAGRVTSLAYDALKRCTTITLPDGKTMSYNYDEGGNLIRSTDPLGKATEYAYDPGYFLTSLTKAGRTTAIAYEDTSFGKRVSSVTDAAGYVTRYATDAVNPNLTRITDPRGGVTEVESSGGRTISLKDPLGNVTRTVYNTLPDSGSFGLPVSIVYPDQTMVAMEYDSRGNLTKQTDALGNVSSYGYDGQDRLVSATDSLQNTWSYGYDASGNLTGVTSPSGQRRASLTYDLQGNVTALEDPSGSRTSLSYDALGNLAGVTGPLGRTAVLGYDAAGLRLVSGTDSGGGAAGFTYDALGRLERLDYAGGGSRWFGYDAHGLASIGDVSGPLLALTRDPRGEVTGVRNRLGAVLSFAYDGNGNMTGWTDEKDRATVLGYDGANRLVSETNASGEMTQREYDRAGNLSALVDPLGRRTEFGYDGRGMVVSRAAPGGTTTLIRDALGRVVGRREGTGPELGYVYDADGFLTQKRQGDTVLASYGYDKTGRLASITGTLGTTMYTRDDLGRVTGIDYPDGKSVSMTYDASDNVSTLTQGDGTVITYRYDARRWLTGVSWSGHTVDFTYDGFGRLLTETRSNGTRTLHVLDGAGRVGEILHEKGGAELVRLSYARDEGGHTVRERVSRSTVPTPPGNVDVTTAFDSANQVMTSGGDTYSYDDRGNLTGIVSGSVVKMTMAYDAENRLTSISRNGSTTGYTYNALGQKIKAVRSGKTTFYYYDLHDRLLFEADGEGQVTAIYVHAGDRLVAMRRGGVDHFYHFDQAGNTLLTTNTSGEVTSAYAYQPFGMMADQTGELANPFTYVGAWGAMDEGEGLYDMRARYYDARTRRFIQRDPIGLAGGTNLYAYVGNSPLDRIDPEGLAGFSVVGDLIEASGLSPNSTGAEFLRNGFEVSRKVVDKAPGRLGRVVYALKSKTLDAGRGLYRVGEAFKAWVKPILTGAGNTAGAAAATASEVTVGGAFLTAAAAVGVWELAATTLAGAGETLIEGGNRHPEARPWRSISRRRGRRCRRRRRRLWTWGSRRPRWGSKASAGSGTTSTTSALASQTGIMGNRNRRHIGFHFLSGDDEHGAKRRMV